MSELENIKSKNNLYEIYTCSGNRVTVKDVDTVLVDFSAGSAAFINSLGEHIAEFMLMNIEGWRIAP